MVAVEHILVGRMPAGQETLLWERLLRRSFSSEERRHAQVGVIKRPLQDKLVGFERFLQGDLTQVEVYKGGNNTLSARLYFRRRTGQDFVPTYIVTTKTGLQALQKTESKLLIDPVLKGDVIQGNFGEINLRTIAQSQNVGRLLSRLLDQTDLVYAERKTTHVYDGKDRHVWRKFRRLTIRRFRDQVDTTSGKYTALVFRRNGRPLAKNTGALNVTNDSRVMAHRPKMQWQPIY